MCTSIRIESEGKNFYWGRTQEFDMPLNYQAVIIPRDYKIDQLESVCEVKYAFAGIGMEGADGVIDGVNEKGLSGGSFYFDHEYNYGDAGEIRKLDKKPLRGEEVVTWILARYGSVREIKEKLNRDVAVSNSKNIMDMSLPQHCSFHDRTGESVVIEPSKDKEFKIFDNPLGVMTNQPSFDWHLKNLQNYTGLSQKIDSGINLNGLNVLGSGKGSGLFGLPGDYTPQSRFIRAAILSAFADRPVDEQAIEHIFHILNSFDITKGVISPLAYDIPQHTQYTSAYDMEKNIVYVHTYGNRAIQSFRLEQEDYIGDSIIRMDLKNEQTVIELR